VRKQARNGRKCITTVEGLPTDLHFERITKALKKSLNCNGSIEDDPQAGKVIQLSGDHRTAVRSFLIESELAAAEDIVVH
jgi:translation initiation factor 1